MSSLLLFTKSHAKHIGSAIKEVRIVLEGSIGDSGDFAATEASQKGVISLSISALSPQKLVGTLLTAERGFTHCGRAVPVEVSFWP